MAKTLVQALADRRRTLGNQYAYIAELEEIEEVKSARKKLENPYSYEEAIERLSRPIALFDGLPVEPGFPRTHDAQRRRTDQQIQQLVRDIHRQIWENRADLFLDYSSRDPVDMLDPVAALEMLGYSVEIVGALGQIAGSTKHVSNVAGLIDKQAHRVLLSSGLPPATRNYTAAHELGHAVMHDLMGMHRDKPLDGSAPINDPQEREAEKFAAYFLMPEKLLTRVFEDIFGKKPLAFNEHTAFALSGSIPSPHWTPRTLREFSRIVSAAERFNGFHIVPMTKRFNVSKEAMAIRLEQLGLVSLRKG
jgi:Zn-dependent peptidase ImmA (M78 family)